MSDFIRQMVGQRRGPMGLGNNPAPFQIQQPGYSGMDALQQFMDSDERRRQEMMASPPRESDFPQGRMMSEPQMDMSPEALRDPNHPFYKRYQPAFR